MNNAKFSVCSPRHKSDYLMHRCFNFFIVNGKYPITIYIVYNGKLLFKLNTAFYNTHKHILQLSIVVVKFIDDFLYLIYSYVFNLPLCDQIYLLFEVYKYSYKKHDINLLEEAFRVY